MHVIVGLGNPGAEYVGTRHNAGFMLVDAVAGAWKFPAFRRVKWARTSERVVRGTTVRLVKPLSFMNRSGVVLGPLLDAGLDPSTELLVVVDEVDLPVGTFRVRARGGAAGHNGLKSIAGALRSEEYARLRIGVGPLPAAADRADFVLGQFTDDEAEEVEALVPTMIDAVDCWLREGAESTMNRFNRRGNRD